jgi:exosortase/archaeosortase family protein
MASGHKQGEGERDRQEKRSRQDKRMVWRFVVTYFVLMGIFFFLMGFAPIQKYFDVNDLYSKAIVFVTHHILALFQVQSSYYGSVISLPGISLQVLFGCNGLEAVMIYAIAILAFPAPWKKKLLGIIGGFVVLQIINIVRIVGLAYAAAHYRSLFKILHIYVAQGVMIAIALGVFFLYLNYAKKEQRTVV